MHSTTLKIIVAPRPGPSNVTLPPDTSRNPDPIVNDAEVGEIVGITLGVVAIIALAVIIVVIVIKKRRPDLFIR